MKTEKEIRDFIDTLKVLDVIADGDIPVVCRTLQWVLKDYEVKK